VMVFGECLNTTDPYRPFKAVEVLRRWLANIDLSGVSQALS